MSTESSQSPELLGNFCAPTLCTFQFKCIQVEGAIWEWTNVEFYGWRRSVSWWAWRDPRFTPK